MTVAGVSGSGSSEPCQHDRQTLIWLVSEEWAQYSRLSLEPGRAERLLVVQDQPRM
jgi:hypothetical protein